MIAPSAMQSDLMPDQFIAALFEGVAPDQWIEFFYIRPENHPDGRAMTGAFHRVGDTTAHAVELQRAHDLNKQGFGVYVGVLPRTRNCMAGVNHLARGKEADVSTITTFWTELDSVKNGVEPTMDAARLMTSKFPPSMVVHSGGGVHAYWRLNAPVSLPLDPAQRIKVKSALRGLGVTLGGDTSVAEFARILRLPGFANTKPGRAAHEVRVLAYTPSRRFALDQFMIFAASSSPANRPIRSNTSKDAIFPEWAEKALRTTLGEGQGQFGGRNNTYYRAAWIAIHVNGMTQYEVFDLVGRAALASGLSEAETRTLIASAAKGER